MLVYRCNAVAETLLDIGFVRLVHVERRLSGHVVVVASRICGQQIVVVCIVIVGIVERVKSGSNRRWWSVAISA